jgi:hypothetical protein
LDNGRRLPEFLFRSFKALARTFPTEKTSV